MSQCLFIHDFYQDGRLNVLAEVRSLQAYGLWTKQKRADWMKSAKASFECTKHTRYSQSGSYYAGRIAGLRSATTAHYPVSRPETHSKMVFTTFPVPLPDGRIIFCGSCGDYALWRCTEVGKPDIVRYRCDRCKQELVRELTVYTTPDGWDWDEDFEDLLPLSHLYAGKIKLNEMKQETVALGKTVLPFAAVISLDLSSMLYPTAHISFLSVLIVFMLVRWQSDNIVRALFWLDEKATLSKWLGLPLWECTLGHENSIHEHFCFECGEPREIDQ